MKTNPIPNPKKITFNYKNKQAQTLYYEGVKLHKHQRFTAHGITNDSVLMLNIDIDGGGKRAKTAAEKEVIK